jgi:hypothetical protein
MICRPTRPRRFLVHLSWFDQSAGSFVPTGHFIGGRAQARSNAPLAAGPGPRAAPAWNEHGEDQQFDWAGHDAKLKFRPQESVASAVRRNWVVGRLTSMDRPYRGTVDTQHGPADTIGVRTGEIGDSRSNLLGPTASAPASIAGSPSMISAQPPAERMSAAMAFDPCRRHRPRRWLLPLRAGLLLPDPDRHLIPLQAHVFHSVSDLSHPLCPDEPSSRWKVSANGEIGSGSTLGMPNCRWSTTVCAMAWNGSLVAFRVISSADVTRSALHLCSNSVGTRDAARPPTALL